MHLRISYEEALHRAKSHAGSPTTGNDGLRGEILLKKCRNAREGSRASRQGLLTVSDEDEMADYFFRLTVATSLILLGFGGYLLYESASSAGPTQLPEILAGALLFSLGTFLLCSQTWLVLRDTASHEENRNS